MTLDLIEEKLIHALENEHSITLSDLGGLPALINNKEIIATSPLMSYFLSITLDSLKISEACTIELAESFILFCFEKVTNELVIQEAINCIERHRPLSKNFEDKYFKILLKKAQNNKKPLVTRVWSLEGAFRVAIDNPAQRYKLLSYLVDLHFDDEPEYLRHAAKIVGLANTFWADDALVSVLEQLAVNDLGADEVYFELGLVSLASALDAESFHIARERLMTACSLFQKSMDRRENRPDAEAFYAAISMLFTFEQNASQEAYISNLRRLQESVSIYNAWHKSDAGSIWLTARNIEMVNWHILATKLEALSGYLAEPSWFEPSIVIEEALLNIYVASRTILKRNKSGGLEKLVQPKIEASLIRNQGQLYALEKWLQRQPPEELGSIGKELIKVIESQKTEMNLGKKLGVAVNASSLATPILSITQNFPEQSKAVINQVLEDCLNLQKKDISPNLERILKNCICEIENINDYKDQRVRQYFNVVFFQTLRFLENRMNMTQKNNPRLRYLFENKEFPKESELQMDYYDFMHGNIAAGDIRVEVSDISSGRVDVYFSFGSVRFVAEVKRDHQDCSFSALRRKYIGQASEYLNTNIKLGFLLVFDWTTRTNGIGSIEEHIRVEKFKPSDSEVERAIIVVRIPGKRKKPSQISKI